LAAFGVETVQRLSPEHALRVEKLFAAVLLAGRDAIEVLLGFRGRYMSLEMALCLLAAFFCTFLESTSDAEVSQFGSARVAVDGLYPLRILWR